MFFYVLCFIDLCASTVLCGQTVVKDGSYASSKQCTRCRCIYDALPVPEIGWQYLLQLYLIDALCMWITVGWIPDLVRFGSRLMPSAHRQYLPSAAASPESANGSREELTRRVCRRWGFDLYHFLGGPLLARLQHERPQHPLTAGRDEIWVALEAERLRPVRIVLASGTFRERAARDCHARNRRGAEVGSHMRWVGGAASEICSARWESRHDIAIVA